MEKGPFTELFGPVFTEAGSTISELFKKINDLLSISNEKRQKNLAEIAKERKRTSEENEELFLKGMLTYYEGDELLSPATSTLPEPRWDTMPMIDKQFAMEREIGRSEAQVVESARENFLVKMQQAKDVILKELENQGERYDEIKAKTAPEYDDEQAEKKRKANLVRVEKRVAKREKEERTAAKRASEEYRRFERDTYLLSTKKAVRAEKEKAKEREKEKAAPKKSFRSTAQSKVKETVTAEDRGFFEVFEEINALDTATEKIETRMGDYVLLKRQEDDIDALVSKITARLREEAFASPDGYFP